MTEQPRPSEPADVPGHGPVVGSDVSVRGVLWFAAGLTVLGIVIHLGVAWLFDYFAARANTRQAQVPTLRSEALTPTPADVMTEPPLEGFKYQQERVRRIPTGHPRGGDPDRYGWVNENEGIVHIPVEEAMKQMLDEQQFKSRSDSGGQRPPNRRRALDSSSGRPATEGQR